MKTEIIRKNIPKEWSHTKLGDILRIGSGKDYKHLGAGDIPVFGTGGYILSVDKELYDGETVCIGRKGTIDKPFYFKGKLWTVDTLFYTYGYSRTTAKYISHVFRNINWVYYNEASGVPSLSKSTIESIKISLPPLPEQTRIVAVLETWDKAIELLSKKIAIKKVIKKGLMQELLTGCKRLKGFTDPWQSTKLGDLCAISRGGSPRPIEAFLTNKKDGLNWLRIGDIQAGNRFIFSTKEKIIKEGLKKTTLVSPGDFILSNSMSFGRPYIMKIHACIHDGWLALKNLRKNIDKNYLYYKLSSQEVQNNFVSISAGSGVQNLKKETVSALILEIPSIPEQTAIADILTTADNEIEALEKKRKIIEQQKKFLLNNLITGRIRLPEFIH